MLQLLRTRHDNLQMVHKVSQCFSLSFSTFSYNAIFGDPRLQEMEMELIIYDIQDFYHEFTESLTINFVVITIYFILIQFCIQIIPPGLIIPFMINPSVPLPGLMVSQLIMIFPSCEYLIHPYFKLFLPLILNLNLSNFIRLQFILQVFSWV